jgi:hypothetical protein
VRTVFMTARLIGQRTIKPKLFSLTKWGGRA